MENDVVGLIREEIRRVMAEEMSMFEEACREGDTEMSASPVVYTRMQMLLSTIDEIQEKCQQQSSSDTALIAKCFGFQSGEALFSIHLPAKDYLVGSEIKVKIIEEDEQRGDSERN